VFHSPNLSLILIYNFLFIITYVLLCSLLFVTFFGTLIEVSEKGNNFQLISFVTLYIATFLLLPVCA